MGINLLEKTELWINEITLDETNLTELAGVVAEVLRLDKAEVMVVDVRPRHITLDILANDIPQESFLGKEKELLAAVGRVEGVTLYPESGVHSNGILGQICAGLQEDERGALLHTVERMTGEISERVRRRAIVFPTGFELQQGLIEDTNTPYIKAALEDLGYTVTVGEVIPDALPAAVRRLEGALNRGYGLIVTTGGVGAEDKDFSVEAIEALDHSVAAPYIVRFTQGTGRHKKDGVRIGVGQEGLSRMVALPGPHDEVELALPILLRGLREDWSKQELAQRLADGLAEKWKRKNIHGEHRHHHAGERSRENEL